jgi:hypothetical protein
VAVGNSRIPTPSSETEASEYCRQVESYLCRKNDGHLIRIVGPAFEQVCAWAARGVPLKVACRGIDRYFERYYAKGPRRRPVRVEFCEADVLDVFDEWRRAVGVPAHVDAEAAEQTQARRSLPAHLERVVARLTALRAGDDRALGESIGAIVQELDAVRASAKGMRGDAREQLLGRLRQLDTRLLETARSQYDASTLQEFERDADAELAPFRERMPRDAYEQSRRACVDRTIRERRRLPVIAFD